MDFFACAFIVIVYVLKIPNFCLTGRGGHFLCQLIGSGDDYLGLLLRLDRRNRHNHRRAVREDCPPHRSQELLQVVDDPRCHRHLFAERSPRYGSGVLADDECCRRRVHESDVLAECGRRESIRSLDLHLVVSTFACNLRILLRAYHNRPPSTYKGFQLRDGRRRKYFRKLSTSEHPSSADEPHSDHADRRGLLHGVLISESTVLSPPQPAVHGLELGQQRVLCVGVRHVSERLWQSVHLRCAVQRHQDTARRAVRHQSTIESSTSAGYHRWKWKH